MYRREGGGGTSKKRYVGIPSPAAAKKAGSQKAINRSTVKTSAPAPAPKPDITLSTGASHSTGHSKPPKVSKSSRPIKDTPYTRSQAKQARKTVAVRKKYALKYLFPQAFNAEADASSRESFYSHPTTLGRNNFTSVSKEMWKELGLKGKMPKIVYNEAPKTKNAAAYAYKGRNAIYVEPGTPEATKYDKGQYTTFAHEAAHTRQTKKDQSLALEEGGAEGFAKLVGMKALKKIGVKDAKFRSSPEYRKYARKVRRRRGKRYITKGQFEER